MRNFQNDTDCFALVGSLTDAMRAQNALTYSGIRAEVVQANQASVKRGCAYAIRFFCDEQERIRPLLRNAGIRVRSYQRGGE